jgi:hypothetical protein
VNLFDPEKQDFLSFCSATSLSSFGIYIILNKLKELLSILHDLLFIKII